MSEDRDKIINEIKKDLDNKKSILEIIKKIEENNKQLLDLYEEKKEYLGAYFIPDELLKQIDEKEKLSITLDNQLKQFEEKDKSLKELREILKNTKNITIQEEQLKIYKIQKIKDFVENRENILNTLEIIQRTEEELQELYEERKQYIGAYFIPNSLMKEIEQKENELRKNTDILNKYTNNIIDDNISNNKDDNQKYSNKDFQSPAILNNKSGFQPPVIYEKDFNELEESQSQKRYEKVSNELEEQQSQKRKDEIHKSKPSISFDITTGIYRYIDENGTITDYKINLSKKEIKKLQQEIIDEWDCAPFDEKNVDTNIYKILKENNKNLCDDYLFALLKDGEKPNLDIHYNLKERKRDKQIKIPWMKKWRIKHIAKKHKKKELATVEKDKKRWWIAPILAAGAGSALLLGSTISKDKDQDQLYKSNTIENDDNQKDPKETPKQDETKRKTFTDSLSVDTTEKQKEIIDRQIIEQKGITPIGNKINLNKEITTYDDPCDEVLVSLGKEPKSTIRENVNSDGNIGEHFVHAICLTEKNGNGQVFEFHDNEELANFLQNNPSIDINKFSISIHATKESNVEEMTQWSGVHIVTDLQGDKHYTGEGKWVCQDDTVQITKAQEKVTTR